MDFLLTPLPFLRLHLDLQGGWYRVLFRCGILAFGIICVFEVWNRATGDPRITTVDRVMVLLQGAQPFLLLLGGSNTIYRALQRDFDTKMLESHRLCPSSGLATVIGYVLGPPVQIIGYTLVILLAGVIMLVYAGVSIGDWLSGHALLYSSALIVWTLTALGGMRTVKPINPSPIIIVAALVSIPAMLLPGVAILLGYGSVFAGIAMLGSNASLSTVQVSGLTILNMVTTALFLGFAAFKYRRPDLPVFNGGRGLIVLAYWLMPSFLGILAADGVGRMQGISLPTSNLSTLTICTLCASMLIAATVVVSTYYAHRAYRLGIEIRGWSDRLSPDHMVIIVTAMTFALLILFLGWERAPQVLKSFEGTARFQLAIIHFWVTLVFSFFLGVCLIHSLFAVFGEKDWLGPRFIVLFAAMAMLTPPIADLIRAQIMLGWVDPDVLFQSGMAEFTWLSGFSPVGSLALIWSGKGAIAMPGLVGLAVLNLILREFGRRLHGNTRS
ncbi:MAG: hypothetical protein ACPGXK_14310 [Phycisphaerae bacterium]